MTLNIMRIKFLCYTKLINKTIHGINFQGTTFSKTSLSGKTDARPISILAFILQIQ